ncbi:MAG TPA: hypothetical protein VN696_12705 [Pyrinomonadaceae bacterium]|nr:hypothetical protein [Pyrinomonadaceae bacterium]
MLATIALVFITETEFWLSQSFHVEWNLNLLSQPEVTSMRITILLVALTLCTLVLSSAPRQASTTGEVVTGDATHNCLAATEVSHDGSTTVYKIKEPVVNKPYQCYDIPLNPGDRVQVSDVRGCVDTGGAGRTWKRYLNPLGHSGDRLYHGRIWIPGATDGLVRIESLHHDELTVNQLPPSYDGTPLHIWLGYEDQKYDDNGYPPDKHKSSTDHQCKDAPNAQVEIRVAAAAGEAAQTSLQSFPAPTAPYDLEWNGFDANLLPLNPYWHFQKNQSPKQVQDIGADCKYFHNEKDVPKIDQIKCTRWSVDIDEGWLGSANCKVDVPRVGSLIRKLFTHGLVAGHINWGVVTYTGKIYFWDYEKFPLDRDHDFYLLPDDPNAGLTTNNVYKGEPNHALGLEFYTRETTHRFRPAKTWWSEFAEKVKKGNPFIGNPFSDRQGSYPEATKFVNGRPAIVIGLLGIDNEHKSHTELHPVFALAIRVDDNGTQSPEQHWAIFASNWGTEGDCSNRVNFTGHYEHQLGRDDVSFFFRNSTGQPMRVDESKTKFYLAENSRTDEGATDRYSARNVADGIALTLYPGSPSRNGKPKLDPVVFGELWLTKQ